MADSRELAKVAYNALDEKKGLDIKIIDISEVSPIADYFVIASAANENQIEAMRDEVDEKLHKAGAELKSIEGHRNSTWILMDYGDVVVHLFTQEDREFYDLDKVWKDGKEIFL